MSLSPIVGAASQVLNLFSNSSANGAANNGSITDSSGNVDLSQAAEFFSNLQNLSQTDSAQFKQLTAQISSQLQAAASSATGSAQSFLSNLSSQFNTASQTGSTSAIEPSQDSGGHHGHHHHLSSSSTANSAQTAYEQSSLSSDSQSSVSGTLQNIYQSI